MVAVKSLLSCDLKHHPGVLLSTRHTPPADSTRLSERRAAAVRVLRESLTASNAFLRAEKRPLFTVSTSRGQKDNGQLLDTPLQSSESNNNNAVGFLLPGLRSGVKVAPDSNAEYGKHKRKFRQRSRSILQVIPSLVWIATNMPNFPLPRDELDMPNRFRVNRTTSGAIKVCLIVLAIAAVAGFLLFVCVMLSLMTATPILALQGAVPRNLKEIYPLKAFQDKIFGRYLFEFEARSPVLINPGVDFCNAGCDVYAIKRHKAQINLVFQDHGSRPRPSEADDYCDPLLVAAWEEAKASYPIIDPAGPGAIFSSGISECTDSDDTIVEPVPDTFKNKAWVRIGSFAPVNIRKPDKHHVFYTFIWQTLINLQTESTNSAKTCEKIREAFANAPVLTSEEFREICPDKFMRIILVARHAIVHTISGRTSFGTVVTRPLTISCEWPP